MIRVRDGRSWLEVTGGPEEHLRRTIERLLPGTLKVLQLAAEEALSESRSQIPVRTEALRDSLITTTDVTQKSLVSVSVHTTLGYAPYAHFSRYTSAELDAVVAKATTPEGREKLRRKMRRIHGAGSPTEALVLKPVLPATVGVAFRKRRTSVKSALYAQLVEAIRG